MQIPKRYWYMYASVNISVFLKPLLVYVFVPCKNKQANTSCCFLWISQQQHCHMTLLKHPPVNMPDMIQKCFGYGQLWPECSQNRAWMYILDPTSCIRFSSVFQKRPGLYCAKLTQIWSVWLGQVLAQRIIKNHWAPFLAECNKPATSFPFLGLAVFFHRQPRSCCAKPGQTRFGSGWLSLSSFGQTDPVWHKNHLARFWPIQIGCELDPACLLGQFAALKSSLKSHLFKLFHWLWVCVWDL